MKTWRTAKAWRTSISAFQSLNGASFSSRGRKRRSLFWVSHASHPLCQDLLMDVFFIEYTNQLIDFVEDSLDEGKQLKSCRSRNDDVYDE